MGEHRVCEWEQQSEKGEARGPRDSGRGPGLGLGENPCKPSRQGEGGDEEEKEADGRKVKRKRG